MDKYKSVTLTCEEGVAQLTLNRPEAMNALNQELILDLMHALEDVENDPSIRVVILTGAGRCFCAGGDVKGMKGFPPPLELYHQMRTINDNLVMKIWKMPKPFIAAVNGVAFGAGTSLMLACDFVLVADNASFNFGFTGVGMLPDMGLSYTLPAAIGLQRARFLFYSAESVSVEDAYEMGLVLEVVPAATLIDRAKVIASKFSNGPAKTIGLCKSMVNQLHEDALRRCFSYEGFAQGVCQGEEEFNEAVTAFMEKRKPVFNHNLAKEEC